MIRRVLEFGDRHVSELMTPRPEIVSVTAGATIGDFLALYSDNYHTRFPVVRDNLDDVVGLVSVKDVMRQLAAGVGLDSSVTAGARPARFVPETKLVNELFDEMRASGDQIVMVADEFGGVAGLVTLKRLVEGIVGRVRDEEQPAGQQDVLPLDENTVELDGGLSISEANERLGLDIPTGDYETVAGFLLEILGSIPSEGAVVLYRNLRFAVLDMRAAAHRPRASHALLHRGMTNGQRPATRRVAMAVRRAFARHGGSLGIGRLVLAVSGGADSMAMLLASAEVGSRLRKRMVVAHFAHGLRPWADRREQALVRRTAADLGLPFEAGQGRTKPSEAAAREERYRFLGRIAAKYDAAGVLTAHTQDDQAETVLLRLTRGAGLRGAGAIRELSSRIVDGRGLTLLRPLLAVNRVETEAVCKEAGVSPARDASNRSLKYARNRVRLRVLRELAKLNPDVRAALAAFAERGR